MAVELQRFEFPEGMKFPNKCCICGCPKKEIIMSLPGRDNGGHQFLFGSTDIPQCFPVLFCQNCWDQIKASVQTMYKGNITDETR